MLLTQSTDNILFSVFYLFASHPNHDVYFKCFFMLCLLNIPERRQLLNIIDIIDLTLLGYYKRVMETLMLLYEHERLQQLYMYM